MKKEFIYYLILTLTIAVLLVFETSLFNDNSSNVSKVIDTASFEKLDIDLDCNIYVSLGDEQKVVFEGPAHYLNKVQTNLEDGILKISCKKPGLFASWFNSAEENPEAVNVYVKLTHASQLMRPSKGRVISSETLLLNETIGVKQLGFHAHLQNILQLIGQQFGYISFR